MKNNKKIIFIIVLCALFMFLVYGILSNNINNFDNNIYNLVTRNMNDTLTTIYKIFTFLASTSFMIGLCLVIFVLFIILKKKNISFIIAGTLIASTILNNVIKLIIRRPRPDVLKLVIEKSFSFPSGHTMAAVSMYGIIIYCLLKSKINKSLKIIFSIILGILPIVVAISRIYLGAHYASDVIGASLISIILLIVIDILNTKYKWLGE